MSAILRVKVALVVQDERRTPKALSDVGSAGKEGRAYVMMVSFKKTIEILF
jgi:hypothetical protein